MTEKLKPETGTVNIKGNYIYCEQIPGKLPEEAELLFNDNSAEAYRTRLQFGLQDDWSSRWTSLSRGEQKRIQVASAFYLEPEILLLDEPTNHLDAESRELLLTNLRRYRGTGVLVSHDRLLLDQLPTRRCFLTHPTLISACRLIRRQKQQGNWKGRMFLINGIKSAKR